MAVLLAILAAWVVYLTDGRLGYGGDHMAVNTESHYQEVISRHDSWVGRDQFIENEKTSTAD